MNKSKIFLDLMAISLFFMACEKDDNTEMPGENEVFMVDFEFTPGTLTVEVGTTVTWTNKDDVPHNVIRQGMMNSSNLSKGEIYTYTFDSEGTFAYDCTIHPGMSGTIVVVAAN